MTVAMAATHQCHSTTRLLLHGDDTAAGRGLLPHVATVMVDSQVLSCDLHLHPLHTRGGRIGRGCRIPSMKSVCACVGCVYGYVDVGVVHLSLLLCTKGDDLTERGLL